MSSAYLAFDQAFRNTGVAIANLDDNGNITHLGIDYWKTTKKLSRLQALNYYDQQVSTLCKLIVEDEKCAATEEVFTGTRRANIRCLVEVKGIIDLALFKEGYEVLSFSSTSSNKQSWRHLLNLDCSKNKDKKKLTLDLFGTIANNNEHIADAVAILFAMLILKQKVKLDDLTLIVEELHRSNKVYALNVLLKT
jgi:Holliday junction resolvasome RuvABC endonuclease subunit